VQPRAPAILQTTGLELAGVSRQGLPVEQVEATGDPMALRVAAIAREEAARVD
jgi:hypothetical protein